MRRHKTLTLSLTLTLTLTLASSRSSAQRAMGARDLWSLGRVGAPALSPDGKQVLYTVTRYDLDALKSKTEIWGAPVAGGAATVVKSPGSAPAWSPDGKQFAYIAGGQVHIGERQITNLPNGAGGPIVWSRDGTKLLVSSNVTPAGDSLAVRLARIAGGKSQAKLYDELGYRHWDEWEGGDRSHVFAVDVATGQATDVTPGSYDTPPIALAGFQDYDISPDGSEIVFTRNARVPTMVGTGNDVFFVPASGGGPRRLGQRDANENLPG